MGALRKFGYLVLFAAIAAGCFAAAGYRLTQEYVAAADALRSRDWVRVTAWPTSSVSWAHRFGGGQFEGRKLGPGHFGTWESDRFAGLRELLAEAAAERRPVSVWVDPDSPVRSMLERRVQVETSLEEAFGAALFAVFAWLTAFHVLPQLWHAGPDEFTPRALPLSWEGLPWMGALWTASVVFAVAAVPVALAISARMLEGEWRAFADLFFLPLPAFALLAVVVLYARHRHEAGLDDGADAASEAS